MDLPELLQPSRIACQADVRSKKRALEAVATLLTGSIDDEDATEMVILDALNTRERLGSTGLGHGVGLPHSRCPFVDKPIGALLTIKEGVDYDSTDGEPVDLVVGLLVPEACNDEHLKILATLAKRFNDEDFRNRLRTHDQPAELFTDIGGELNTEAPAGDNTGSNSGSRKSAEVVSVKESADKNGSVDDTIESKP